MNEIKRRALIKAGRTDLVGDLQPNEVQVMETELAKEFRIQTTQTLNTIQIQIQNLDTKLTKLIKKLGYEE